MLKRKIEYTDFDGEKRDSTWYFNLSEPELVELEVEFDAGFEGMINKIIETKDRKGLVAIFKRVVLMSVGEQRDDGGILRFVKTDEIRTRFSQTMAYNTLFMELATDDEAAATFMKGVLPARVAEDQDRPKVEPTGRTNAGNPGA
jgi:hypothetical protein